MSTELIEQGQIDGPNNVSMVQFGGGKDRGLCIQITASGQNSYVQMTKDEAREVACEMLAWAGGNDGPSEDAASLCHVRRALNAISAISFRARASTFNDVIIKVHSLVELQQARHELRKTLGHWNDTYVHTWTCGTTVLARFKGPGPYSIWLESTYENFPSELLSAKCRLVKQTTETVALDCDIGGSYD